MTDEMKSIAALPWRKSQRSEDKDCVEVALYSSAVLVRDSHDHAGGFLRFSVLGWRALLEHIDERN
ncbi:DUF397 domain-containing protein [Actinomadura flavalba]|uniref:DUF397 domain-containing protein n=1 Tax=Actinomadura flavalba TaxID=1120938 RepID=UPI0009DB827F|nr:DUF397 domain-containing protein [Actinomadura flavalba]